MSSGYGVDKPRVEEHPHRQVPRERFTPSLTQFGGTPSVGGLFEDMRTNTGPVNRNSGYVPSMGWGTQRAPQTTSNIQTSTKGGWLSEPQHGGSYTMGGEPHRDDSRGDYGGVREPRKPLVPAGGGSAYAERSRG